MSTRKPPLKVTPTTSAQNTQKYLSLLLASYCFKVTSDFWQIVDN